MVNINQFMKQAQSIQKKMQEMQELMEQKEYIGKSGGGLVCVNLTGKGECLKVSIDDSLVKIEDKEMLQDLIVAAFNDAKHKIEADTQNSLSSALGGVSMPPGFKFPF
jgi:DNA-binding YbaB/EbfC family protein